MREGQKMLKTVKFGGSSVAGAEQFRKVKAIVEADPARRIVVSSAAGKRSPDDHKLTDLLYLCHAHLKYGVSCDDIMDGIEARFKGIRDELGIEYDVEAAFRALRARLTKDMSVDELVSRGEYFTSRLLADYLGYAFVDATDCVFFGFDGQVDREKSYAAIAKAVEEHGRVVIPGFYGAKEDGTIKTFSRGGSDITGSIVSRAVRATCYENWTDVSGFLIADPRIIDNPKPIKTITYRELRELSYMGAGVLHEDAVFPVRKAGIPINIRNTNAPEDEGTWIVESTCHQSKYTITGIAGKKGFVSVNIDKDMMNSEIGFGRKVLSAFEDNGISFEHMPSGIDTMTIFVHQPEFEGKEQAVISAIHRYAQPDSIELESDLALIAVVGRGMKSTRGTAGRIFSALAHANINVKMIDQGSSELNIIIGVSNADFENAIKAIYDIFVITQL